MKINNIQLGLKSSPSLEQLNSRLKYHPDTLEFYTTEKDFTADGLRGLKEAIQVVKNQGINQIILHHPMTFQNEFLELITPKKVFPDLYYFIEKSTNDLLQLAFDLDTQVLVHGSYELRNKIIYDYYGSWDNANKHLFDELERYDNLGKNHIFFENSISQLFYFGDPIYDKEIVDLGVKLAFDVSHSFIKMKGDNQKLIESLKLLKHQVKHYHLVDSMGQTHDSLPLGQGKIDWQSVYDCLNPAATTIYEIDLQNVNDPEEQLRSHQYALELLDR